MSKQHKFSTYDKYINAQLRLTRKKVNIGFADRCFTSDKAVDAIKKHHKEEVKNGLCHGVRKGYELDMFEKEFSGRWVGTEITPELCDGKRILHRDFNSIDSSWIGKFDIIYSNSYDHSNDPWTTIKTWISCLSETGRLYIEWTIWHNKLSRGRNKADCFAASNNEYRDIFERAGKVEDVLFISDRSTKNNFKFLRHIFVIH